MLTQSLLYTLPGSAFTHLPATISTFSVHIISLTQFPHQMLISPAPMFTISSSLISSTLKKPQTSDSHRSRSIQEGYRSHSAASGLHQAGEQHCRDSNNIGTLLSALGSCAMFHARELCTIT